LVRPVEEYIGVNEVLQTILPSISKYASSESVDSKDSFERVSAVDVLAESDSPPGDISHMDGYAVRASDLRNATPAHPATLRVVGQVPLGEPPKGRIGLGQAMRVNTGSFIPRGADTVVQVEAARTVGTTLMVDFAQASGLHVYSRGRDVRQGERVLVKGRVIRAQDVGLLLGLGIQRVEVFKKPRVAVVATGSELTDVSMPSQGRIIDSHSHVFRSLLRCLGCEPLSLGTVGDDSGALSKRLKQALNESDFVLTLGGTSIGEHDLIGSVVSRIGPEVLIHGIRMDRGRVTGVATINGKPLLMLPGPVQGAMSAFVLLGVPIIQLLTGSRGNDLRLTCRLGSGWHARSKFEHFTKVVYVRLDTATQNVAWPVEGETESATVLTKAEGYIVVPERTIRLKRGSRVRVNLLPGFSLGF
jgi:molybdenum cofactor synthesis domain-containing protein